MIKIATALATVLLATNLWAQDDPLSYTTPAGQVLHFETPEQKTKFLSARERLATAAAAATPAPSASPHATVSFTGSALDEKPSGSGKVNVSAPTFTAEYYMLAPETWADKPITLSVAYLRRDDSSKRLDGMVEIEANTYGTIQASGEQAHGGYINIVATPEAAARILPLAGTRMQSGGWNYKTTLLKGIFKKSTVGNRQYFVFVDK